MEKANKEEEENQQIRIPDLNKLESINNTATKLQRVDELEEENKR